MANVTKDEIKIMNELYYKLKSYAAVARETGRSASTVKRYIIPNYVPESQLEIVRFNADDFPSDIPYDRFSMIEDLGVFCILTDEEKEEMKELYKEVLV